MLRLQRTRGITITELLVALTIIGIAFTALAMAQVTSLHVTRASTDAAVARDAAVQMLELIRAYGYSAFRACPDASSRLPGAPACKGTKTASPTDRFTVSWVVDNPLGTALNSPYPSLLGVQVVVTWDDQSFELAGYLSCADMDAYSATEVVCSSGAR